MSSLADRLGPGERLANGERARDLQAVSLLLVDGTEIRGVLHRAAGTRTLDYLNRQAESFIAMTQAVVSCDGRTDSVVFIAINKSHIVRLIEAPE
jgi:hypothetical protein